jgi:hypothetical protein
MEGDLSFRHGVNSFHPMRSLSSGPDGPLFSRAISGVISHEPFLTFFFLSKQTTIQQG